MSRSRFAWVFISMFVFSTTSAGASWTEEDKVTATIPVSQEEFGDSVGISGDTMVVGARWYNQGFTPRIGAAYVFVRNGSNWDFQQMLLAPDAAQDDHFGDAAAIDGDTLVIGAPGDNNPVIDGGSAYVFVRSGNTWSFQAKLLPSDPTQVSNFGGTVAISGETIVGGGTNVSIYTFVRTGTVWTQQQRITPGDPQIGQNFGTSVGISGDTVIAGASGDDVATEGAGGGAAYVFVRGGTVWTQQTKLVGSTTVEGDTFGHSVAISGNTAVAGARSAAHPDFPFAGSAYVFARSGVAWSQQAQLFSSNPSTSFWFGHAVAIEGDTVAVGIPGDNTLGGFTGSADVFGRSGSTWNHEQYLLASDAGSTEWTGWSIDISGDRIAVGSRYADTIPAVQTGPGAAYVFREQSTPACCAGDLSGNNQVQTGDISPFVSVLLTGTGTPAELCAADVNGNAAINGGDIQPFVAKLLAGGTCP